MTDIRPSPEMLDAAAANRRDLRPCPICHKDYLEGFEHHHETPLRPGYDPMGTKPSTLDELIRVIRREYRLELPSRLHVQYVPTRSEPIGVSQYSAEASGYVPTGETVDELDVGALGSPAWSPAFHRRVGAVTYWEGEQTVEAGDWGIFPWALVIETRMDRWCRSRHGNRPDLWWEHRGKPICQPMTRMVIVSDYSVDMTGLEYEITPERAAIVLQEALGRVWGQVSNLLNRLPIAA